MKEIHLDLEFKKSCVTYNKNHAKTIKFNLSSAGEHVLRAECNNCVVKEIFRAEFYQLPYQLLLRTFLAHLVMGAAIKLILTVSSNTLILVSTLIFGILVETKLFSYT